MLDPNSGDCKNSPNECSIDHNLTKIEENWLSKLNFAKKLAMKTLFVKRNKVKINKQIHKIIIIFFDLKLQIINIKKHSDKDIKDDDETIITMLESKINSIKTFFKLTFILCDKILAK